MCVPTILATPFFSLWSVINFCDTPINCFTVRCVIQIIFGKMNCCIPRSRHKDSPYQRIRIEVVRVVSWFATNFLSQVWVDFLKMWDRGRRYLVIVWPPWVDVDDVWTFSCRFHRTRSKVQVFVCFCSSKARLRSVFNLIAALENSMLRHFDLNL